MNHVDAGLDELARQSRRLRAEAAQAVQDLVAAVSRLQDFADAQKKRSRPVRLTCVVGSTSLDRLKKAIAAEALVRTPPALPIPLSLVYDAERLRAREAQEVEA
jgi:hypothetical protein